MKLEHKDLTPTELALLTWYKPDNPLYRNPEHPTIKLAGEIGELLDLYGKHKYKPGFDWMKCKWCGVGKEDHSKNNSWCFPWDKQHIHYTPLVLDELGDIWYYLRILSWMSEKQDKNIFKEFPKVNEDELDIIVLMYSNASTILSDFQRDRLDTTRLTVVYNHLIWLLDSLDTTIEELTLLNYYKLNSEETAHGWKDAR